jgi:hypothetical protein
MQDYLKGVEGFINFILFNMKNISGVKLDVYMYEVKKQSFTIKML